MKEGEVFTSSAGTLKCKRIIHAVGPRWQGGNSNELENLHTCIVNCFNETARHNISSVAIPPISTGVFFVPLKEAVETIVKSLYDRDTKGAYLPKLIYFVDTKDDSLELFKKELCRKYQGTQTTDDSIPLETERYKLMSRPKPREPPPRKKRPPRPTRSSSFTSG